MEINGIDAVTLAGMVFEKRSLFLGPWLSAGSLGMVYGWRGVGKTQFMMQIAYALGSGMPFLDWDVPRPVKALYIDGEMGASRLQARQDTLASGIYEKIPLGQLSFLTYEEMGGIAWNLADLAHQKTYSNLLKDFDVCIIDNLDTCVRPERGESDVECWAKVQAWAIQERGKRKTLIFVHHAGKGGTQRGTSTRETVLDYVIQLRRPFLYEAIEGCVFELYFEKNRDFFGQNAAPRRVQLSTNGHGTYWSWCDLFSWQKKEVTKLKGEGFGPYDIAAKIGLPIVLVKQILANEKLMGADDRNKGGDDDNCF